MDKYFMWIHYERLHNHNKAKHNKTVCILLGIYCTCLVENNFVNTYRWRGILWNPLRHGKHILNKSYFTDMYWNNFRQRHHLWSINISCNHCVSEWHTSCSWLNKRQWYLPIHHTRIHEIMCVCGLHHIRWLALLSELWRHRCLDNCMEIHMLLSHIALDIVIFMPDFKLNTSRSSNADMSLKFRPSLFQIMARRLFGANLFSG